MSIEQVVVIVGIISTVVTLIGAIVTVAFTVYTARANRANIQAQTKHLDAQTSGEEANEAEIYARATREYAEELVQVRAQFKSFRDESETREQKLQEALGNSRQLIVDLTTKLDDVQDWADRLFHQVKSLGGEPVPFRKPSKHKAAGSDANTIP